MIRTHHQQPTLWTGFLNEEVNDLWEPWMRAADPLLDDEQLIDQIFEAQGRRWMDTTLRTVRSESYWITIQHTSPRKRWHF